MNQPFKKMKQPALVAALLGGLAMGYGYVQVDRLQFLQSYLLGFLYILAFAVGSLLLLMISHLVAGRWSRALQRPLEAATRTFPVLLVLFMPLLKDVGQLYAWARPEAIHDQVLLAKSAYLNPAAFFVRATIYFMLWSLIAYLLSHWSERQDADPAQAVKMQNRMRKLSGIGLPLICLATTFASFDWVMSLEPKWYSTLYGALFLAGQVLSALCLMVVLARSLSRTETAYGQALPLARFHDFGTLLFAVTTIWAYFGFSQFLVIWSGNLPEEVEYYLHRSHGGWKEVAMVLAVLHFALPFAVLLFKANKERLGLLVAVALLILVLRPLDFLWMVTPAFRPQFYVHWLDVACVVGLTGLWLVAFFRQLDRHPLLPLHDPRFESSTDTSHV